MALAILRNAGSLMVRKLAGNDRVTYWHRDTDETIEVAGFMLEKLEVKDPVSGRTEFQNAPRFRLADIQWPSESLAGDEITDKDGTVWEVLEGVVHASGSATVYVTLPSKRR